MYIYMKASFNVRRLMFIKYFVNVEHCSLFHSFSFLENREFTQNARDLFIYESPFYELHMYAIAWHQ